jgi:hypothetical protein
MKLITKTKMELHSDAVSVVREKIFGISFIYNSHDSFFENFDVSLDDMRRIILEHFVYTHTINDVCRETGYSQKTISRIYRCLRRIIELDLNYRNELFQLGTDVHSEEVLNREVEVKEDEDMIEEEGKLYLSSPVVEADETLIGHFTQGESVIEKQTWVFGIYDRKLKLGRCWLVPDRTADTLCQLLQKNVQTSQFFKTRVYTDYMRSYLRCEQLNYNHCRVNHSNTWGFNTYTTNHIENYWNELKYTGLFSSGLYSLKLDYINSVLAEAQFRVLFRKPDFRNELIEAIKRWYTMIDYDY